MGVSWDRDDKPTVSSSLWSGVINALIIEGCVLLILLPIAYGLGWIG